MNLSNILQHWDINFAREREDFVIAGSPERTETRLVIEDQSAKLFVLEAVAGGLLAKKRRIAQILEHLSTPGLPEVFAYRRSRSGKHILPYEGRFWQVVPYVPGIQLDRPKYVFEAWRGTAAADFLLRLRNAAPALNEPVFSLPDYIEHLMPAIQKNRPEVLPKVNLIYEHVKKHLFPVYSALPVCFAHGDLHAINIIWKEQGIAAVIDWEFCGLKPELYDAANMVTCLGIEDPECLWSGAPVSFMERLRASGRYSALSFKHFPALLIGLRFAWLSEWLRKNDDEMLRMEFDYFDVLVALAAGGSGDGSSL
ncbi:MAG: aminoglycoside phosphotransferase family protein [Candidatus Omnitrophica bacterium]|nr:aminoglycoside phosphotransferase family protein [Candidatus Omnitrophota bacterium]